KGLAGNLDLVSRVVKLGVYVASSPDFYEQHIVANSASDLLLDVFGEPGRHARFAIGVSSLPLNALVEIELTVELN
ncbi:MAG: RidA family protein, partial [Leptospira sp.]|nr:RidA family protein [Leptospira sp.]